MAGVCCVLCAVAGRRTSRRRKRTAERWVLLTHRSSVRYDTIGEFNVDSKAEYTA